MANHMPRSRATILVSVLLLTMGLAAVLAYEAWDAERSHRSTAERTIRDYAAFAAWEYGASVKEMMYSNILWLFSPIVHAEPLRAGVPLKSPEVLVRPEARQKLCPGDPPPYAFRLEVATKEVTYAGQPPSVARRDFIRGAVLAELPKYKRDWAYHTMSGPVDGRPMSVIIQVKWNADATPVAVYGVEFCVLSLSAGAFPRIMEKYQVLPPALTRGLPNDSLFSVVVRDGAGRPLYRSPVQYASTFVGEHTLDAHGGLRTTIAINPAIADRLLIGGLPHSRFTLILALLALTGVLVGIGLLQLKREGELARLRSNFIASVSHELRTPLAQVRMFAETLRLGRVRSEAERARSLAIIDQEARRLTHLVENILQFSRAERHTVKLCPRACVLATEVREALDGFAPIAAARRVTFELALDESAVAMVDVDAFRQIVLNLIDNAVKYGRDGQTVRVGLRRRDLLVRLEVEDQGPGIPAGAAERIWTPFFRLERDVSSAIAGSGIGLAVVRDLVTRHGGTAGVENRQPRGARFFVDLPGVPNVAQSAPRAEAIGSRGTPPAGTEAVPSGSGE